MRSGHYAAADDLVDIMLIFNTGKIVSDNIRANALLDLQILSEKFS